MAFWWQGKPSNLPELFYSALLHKGTDLLKHRPKKTLF